MNVNKYIKHDIILLRIYKTKLKTKERGTKMGKTKNKQKKILKGNKGITLIALVITIIVLLILAAVSIATLTR